MSEPRRPDNIPGYIHPETNSTAPKGVSTYKTFTEGQKPKKKEKFGSTYGGTQYSTMTYTEEDVCPQCSQPAVHVCNCAFSDKRCKEGHIWYTDRSGAVKLGNPHK